MVFLPGTAESFVLDPMIGPRTAIATGSPDFKRAFTAALLASIEQATCLRVYVGVRFRVHFLYGHLG